MDGGKGEVVGKEVEEETGRGEGEGGGCWEEFKRVTRGGGEGVTNIFEDEPGEIV